MSRVPFHRRPTFAVLLFAVALGATWIYDALLRGDLASIAAGVLLDLLLLFLLTQLCLLFFSQFTIPVRGLRDRLRSLSLLRHHMRRAHGPILFVKNGRKVERQGEGRRGGPGLVWIDTASAVVTRVGSGPMAALGPGVHFLGPRERVEKTFSLHTQEYCVGPNQDEDVFGILEEGAGEDQHRRHALTQERRQMVAGLTRDGHEVVPEFRIRFRLDGVPAKVGEPGSRFGFARDSVQRAALSEGVHVDPITGNRSPVPWNQLPGLVAVELWREYLAKFTLDELFTQKFDALPEVLQPQDPPPTAEGNRENAPKHGGRAARLVRRLNASVEQHLGRRDLPDERPPRTGRRYRPAVSVRQARGRTYTALQIISHMVEARMLYAAVPSLDEYGRNLKGHAVSDEYARLRDRGIRVLDVVLGGCRFDPGVEQQIVRQWKSTWLGNATTERGRIEQLELLAGEAGKQRALLEHADHLAAAILGETAFSVPAMVGRLLKASHTELLADERLHGRGRTQLEGLSSLSRWVESSSDE